MNREIRRRPATTFLPPALIQQGQGELIEVFDLLRSGEDRLVGAPELQVFCVGGQASLDLRNPPLHTRVLRAQGPRARVRPAANRRPAQALRSGP